MLGNVVAGTLLSRAEQLLYGRLVRAFPGHIVLSKVALSRLLVDRADAGVADFVVCRSDFTALAVVDLDHGEKDRGRDQYLKDAGVRVIRLQGVDLPDERALKALVGTMSMRRAS